MDTRDWPIRAKLTALVVTPVAALLALWIFATTLTFGPALDLLAARTLLADFGRPGERVVAELQRERRASVIQLAGTDTLPALAEQRRRTDEAIVELRRRMDSEALRDAAGDLLDARLTTLGAALEALPAGRGFIDRRQVDRAGVIGLYSGMISSAFQAFAATAALPDAELNRQALALTAIGRSRELLGQTDAVLAGALVTGRFTEGEHLRLVRTIANERFLAETAVADLPPTGRAAYQRLVAGEAFVRLRTMQERVLSAGPSAAPPVDAREWQTSQEAVQQELRDFELSQADRLAERSVPVAVTILARLGVAGVLGLAAIVVSLLVAFRVGRTLARRLTAVRGAALELAEHRLPDVVARLRRGEQVDVAREAPPLSHGADEIGDVSRAFTDVSRVAVRSAIDEVTLRRGLNEVFLNLARRSQGLVHRQLAVLDRMERRAEDPDELAELFRVDHLATRLRRHAEDLVILAGAAPGRGWRQPVALLDVLRGATSEVEAYERVDIGRVEPAGLLGRAVADVIHLLAELIENATAFSPPERRVEVTGTATADGYLVEIVDHGLGMSPQAVEDANRRLATPPEFDPADSARLGLFVVSRLAARHDVGVTLRAGMPVGLTALVRLPADLITEEPEISPPARDRPATSVSRLTTLPRPPRTAPDRAEQTALPFAPARTSSVEAAVDGDSLPRRVRRRGPAARPRTPAGHDTPSARSPEEVRRQMSALQAGTARGRLDSSGVHPVSTARPGPADGDPGRAGDAGPPLPPSGDTGAPPPPSGPAATPDSTATERDA
ncbi:nitrate- and nitrite sensing domain-containing protein [Micromonospora sp. WMMD714]|uniref:sensor histidine kinase n=1 Tax=Micromonospora sp. WMMD714 TaxID=3016097 RepID=UPI00249AB32A|nr:nitrate- and nitrite sensing domain-containing protein [Micromonospora sp. WMMD714]WFE62010.1 nitrate- and nitrite sensing domain-containing protein [Micromonospora sp. WMMD714]